VKDLVKLGTGLPIPEIWKGKKEEKSESSQFHLYSDSVAICKTQQPHHPSGTSSEGTTSPEYREIGLAGFRAKKNPSPPFNRLEVGF
jgi:hypothetical protein